MGGRGCGVGGGGVCEKCVCGLKGNMMARFNMHISYSITL